MSRPFLLVIDTKNAENGHPSPNPSAQQTSAVTMTFDPEMKPPMIAPSMRPATVSMVIRKGTTPETPRRT
jgi:hypothetical protein